MHQVIAGGALGVAIELVEIAVHDEDVDLLAHLDDLVELVVGFEIVGLDRGGQEVQAGLVELAGEGDGVGFAGADLDDAGGFGLLVAIDGQRDGELLDRVGAGVSDLDREADALARTRHSGLRRDVDDGDVLGERCGAAAAPDGRCARLLDLGQGEALSSPACCSQPIFCMSLKT